MKSGSAESINELINKLRLGETGGIIEILISNKGKVNKIVIKKKMATERKKIEDEIKKVKIERPELSSISFSDINVRGNFSGIHLNKIDFSNAMIEESNFSNNNMADVSFYKTTITQTDLSNSYNLNIQNSYLTGSVNLYNVNNRPAISSYDSGNEYNQLKPAMGDDADVDFALAETPFGHKHNSGNSYNHY